MNRSFLYVPADRPDRVVKALVAGADAVIIDLEDAVAPTAKATARAGLVAMLPSLDGAASEVWVRINAGDEGRADLAALRPAFAHVAGLLLAKCDTEAWIDEVAGRVPDLIALSPLIESARAVRDLAVLAEHPRVAQCQLGEIDLLADLGAAPVAAPTLIGHARTAMVYAAAAAGIHPPIGGVETAVRDLDALAEGSTRLAALGFGGRAAIHPSQIPVINAAFTPSADEIAAAVDAVSRYDDALATGVGAIVGADGSMIDEAVVRRARQVLARSGSHVANERNPE